MLKLKADKNIIDDIKMSTASKDELLETNETIINLESQLNNALVLFIE
jgi:hypothetical protein